MGKTEKGAEIQDRAQDSRMDGRKNTEGKGVTLKLRGTGV